MFRETAGNNARSRWVQVVAACTLALHSIPVKAADDPRQPQWIFLNRAPGLGFNQNHPESITETLFRAPFDALGTRGRADRQVGLSFVFSYLNGPAPAVEQSLRRVLTLSARLRVPVLITLDGQNWWDSRPDLWNWWDPARPGFSPDNRVNVEWTGWGPDTAVKIAWRNWGRQIRVAPPPNLAAPRYRAACRDALRPLLRIVRQWASALPSDDRRLLFPGVKVGWEASIGINAYVYPDADRILREHPDDSSGDPPGGLNLDLGFAGGLQPLGYAATTSMHRAHPGEITLADQERAEADYLTFLSRICHDEGFPRDQVFTHAGGQYRPWKLHISHAAAINRYATPGWSLYGTPPADAGDLGKVLQAAMRKEWAASEWLPGASTAEAWKQAIDETLAFRSCRFLSIYNWEGIRGRPEAIAGIRRSVAPGGSANPAP